MQTIPILMYHSLSDEARPAFKRLTVPPELFSRQMAYLRQGGYEPLTVTQLVTAMTGGAGELPARPVVLTFDDGFADFYTAGFPVLRQHGFAATLYVVTGFVGGTSGWLQKEGEATRSMLSWAQLAEINAAGIECGAHSHHHLRLDTLSLSAAREEIVACKRLLEEHLARNVSTFAYPFGCYNDALIAIIREAGFSSACAVRYRAVTSTDDPFTLGRLIITPDMGIEEFAALLETG